MAQVWWGCVVKKTKPMISLSTQLSAAGLGAARKRGVTLIEAVLYTAIALTLTVGGLVFFQQASLAQRTSAGAREISAIASEVRALYQSQPSFAGLSEQVLINAGAVPASIIGSSGTLRNAWGGSIVLRSNTNGIWIPGRPRIPNDSFFLTYGKIPPAACTRLASANASGIGLGGNGIYSLRVRRGDIIGPFPFAPLVASGEAMNPTTVAGRCYMHASESAQNDVDFQILFTR
jgi:hypothetical protein